MLEVEAITRKHTSLKAALTDWHNRNHAGALQHCDEGSCAILTDMHHSPEWDISSTRRLIRLLINEVREQADTSSPNLSYALQLIDELEVSLWL